MARHDEDSLTMAVAATLEYIKRTPKGYEVYKQLQEKAGPRQVKDPRLGLTHNFGGGIWGGIGCIAITGNEMDRR